MRITVQVEQTPKFSGANDVWPQLHKRRGNESLQYWNKSKLQYTHFGKEKMVFGDEE